MTIKIKDWELLFENGESRRYKMLKWIPLPNKQDGAGYRRLAIRRDSPTIFAAWILMLQLASKRPRGSRGLLKNNDGTDMTTEDMAFATGFPEAMFEKAIPVLMEPKIGWLVADLPQKGGKQTRAPVIDNITEHNTTLDKNKKGTTPTIEEVIAYCKLKKYVFDPEVFWHYYETRGWVLTNGKKMVSWKSCATTWHKKDYNQKTVGKQPKKEYLN